MNGAEIAFWAFIGSAFLFGYLAMREARHVKSVFDFFHDDRVSRNVLSYTVANITLGTGLVYIFSAIGSLGALFLVVPFMMLLGYVTLARFLFSYGDDNLFKENLIKGLSLSIDKKLEKESHFAAVLSIILTIVFTLILSFEIFASSKLLASIMFTAPTVRHEVFAGTAVFLIALLYSLWGGFKAVQTTDRIQLVFIGFLLFILAVIFSGTVQTSSTRVVSPVIPPITTGIVFGTIAAGLSAFTTQFYSILNLCAASQQAQEDRRLLFDRIGLFTFVILTIITVGALVVSITRGVPFTLLRDAIEIHSAGARGTDVVYSTLLMLGMASVLFSTVDTLIVSITQIAYSNVYGLSASDRTKDPNELRRVRFAMAGIGLFVFAILALVWFHQPNLFSLLLAIVSGNDAIAPLLILLVVLYNRDSMDSLRGPWGIPLYWAFIVLFLTAVAFALSFALLHLPYTVYVGPVVFVIASVIAFVILKRGR